MDFSLTEEQLRLQQVARRFAYEEIQPRAQELDAQTDPRACYPQDLVRRASELGLRTLKIPRRYGGLEADCLTEIIVLEELCVGDIGFGMTLNHAWREGYVLAAYTTDEQRERFLPPFLRNDVYATSFAITEPHSGSDNGFPYTGSLEAGPRTTAVLDGDEWVINGRKCFITNANVTDLVILMARTNTRVPWTEGVSLILVPSTAPGFSVGGMHDKLGIRLNQNAELVFDNCRVPKNNLVGEVNRALDLSHEFNGGSKAKEGAKSLGVARAAYEHAMAWARERTQGGKTFVEHQAVASALADSAMEIEAARLLMQRAAWAVDHEPKMAPALEDMAEVLCAEVAVRAALKALDVFGTYGVMRSYPIEKLVRDSTAMLHAGCGNQAVRVRLAALLARHTLPSESIRGNRR